MWKWFRYVVREFGYFSPSLKRGTFVLIGIIVLLQLLIFTFRFYSQNYIDNQEQISIITADSILQSHAESIAHIHTSQISCCVDPNTASADTFITLGFSKVIANRIINYRNKGGRFYTLNDLYKIYGIDTSLLRKLRHVWSFPSLKTNQNITPDIFKVEINTADSLLLEKLSGIGPILAMRIIKYRQLLGGYYSIEQVKEVYGLHETTYQRIKHQLMVDTTKILRFSIQEAPFRQLIRHPYIGKELAQKIVQYRKKQKIYSLHQLVNDSILTSEKAMQLAHYLLFQNE
jgi:competence ComEA-like helix-hairpin-helix protein